MESKQSKVISCVIDTDITIDFLRRRSYARALLEKWSTEGLLAISALTQLEIYQGMKASEEAATSAFLDGLISVVVNIPISRRAGRLLAGLRSRGLTVGIADAIIAATSLELGVPLLTNNIEHYPFEDLEVIRGFRE